jgi:hypothetical protein
LTSTWLSWRALLWPSEASPENILTAQRLAAELDDQPRLDGLGDVVGPLVVPGRIRVAVDSGRCAAIGSALADMRITADAGLRSGEPTTPRELRSGEALVSGNLRELSRHPEQALSHPFPLPFRSCLVDQAELGEFAEGLTRREVRW